MKNYNEQLKDEILSFSLGMKKRWAKERKPYSAFMELTPKCNMNCVHCYLQEHHGLPELSYNEITEIIDILYQKGILFLTLSGGEIFTRKDFIDIYMYAKKKGFIIELFSNGLNLTDEILDVLQKYPPVLIEVSLYGACEETYKTVTGVTGAFEKVLNNCQKIKNADIRLSLKSPIIKETALEVEAMRAIAEEIGVPFCVSYEIDVTIDNDDKVKEHQLPVKDMLKYEFDDYVRYGDPTNNTNTDIDGIYDIADDALFICNVGQSSFVIDYEGRMCPCMKFRHRGIKLNRKNFDEIWEKFGHIKNMKATKGHKCITCEARYYCDACAAEREFVLGDLEAVDDTTCKYAMARHAYYKKGWQVEDVLKLFN